MESSGNWSLISLNISGLNLPMKRHRSTESIWKQSPSFCCIQDPPPVQRQALPDSKDWEKILQSNGPKIQAGVGIIISDKVLVKLKLINGDEGYFIFIITEKNPSR